MDKMKIFFRQILANTYTRTILWGFGIVILMLLVLMIFLRITTKHNDSFAVPNFRGMNEAEYTKEARKLNLRVEIADSAFLINRNPGSVIEQNPKPGAQVKTNRRIFLTIVARTPKKICMPNVVGFTLRQAKANLEQKGLKIGSLAFKYDLGVNNVLNQNFNGKTIDAGTMIPEGSIIELVLGRGMYGERASLPLLVGSKLEDAKNQIIEASLNIGKIRFDETIKDYKDSLEARVYSQYPAYSLPNDIAFGSSVNIWLTINQARIPEIKKDSLLNQHNTQQLSEEEILE